MMTTTTRLSTIAVRQQKSRLRDAMFAAAIALAAVVSASSVGTAIHAASSHAAQR